jgi:hypothetical protein
VCRSEERLYLLCHIRKGSRSTGLELGHRFRAIVRSKFVLTSGNQECLLRPEAAFFDGHANLVPQFGPKGIENCARSLF